MAKSGPSRKAIIGWTLAMLVALGLAWFVGAVVVPVCRVRAVIAGLEELPGDPWNKTCPDAVAPLGGGERAAWQLALYLRLPDTLAPGKYEAFGILTCCGKPAAPVLAENLKRPSEKHRELAARALALLGADCEEAVPELIHALNDPSLSAAVGYALSQTRSGRIAAIPVFIDDLQNRKGGYMKADGRWHYASMTLGRMAREDQAVARKLLEEIRHFDPRVRAGLARALGEAGANRSLMTVPALLRTMEDPEPIVRRAAADGLARLGPAGSRAVSRLSRTVLEDADEQTRRSAARALGLMRDLGAHDALAQALKDSGYDVRISAVEAIAKLAAPDAPQLLIGMLKDVSPSVRKSAVYWLGELKSAESVSALIGMLRDKDNEVCTTAVYALGKIGRPESVDALAEAAKSEQLGMRRGVAQALGGISSPGTVKPLIALLSDPDSTTRTYAVRSLGKTKDPRAITPLIAVLRYKNDAASYDASVALGQMGEPAVEPLLVAVKDESPEVRAAAVRALGISGSRRAIGALEAALDDPLDCRVREAATEALEKIKAPSTSSGQAVKEKKPTP